MAEPNVRVKIWVDDDSFEASFAIPVRVKIWVDDDSFEASFAIPVTATPEQISSFVKTWFGALNETLKLEQSRAPSEPVTPVSGSTRAKEQQNER